MKTKFLLAAVLAAGLAIPALAGKIDVRDLFLTSNAAAVTNRVAVFQGYLEAIRVDNMGGSSVTGTVTVTLIPTATTLPPEPLFAKTFVAGSTSLAKPGTVYDAITGTGGTTNVGRRIVWDGFYQVVLSAASETNKQFHVEFVTETDSPQ